MAAVEPAVASKGDFARRCNVSPGRVSQWIASGQIGPDALVGEGRSAQILVDKALSQLKRRLDIGQRFGNGLGTRLDASPSSAPIVVSGDAPPLSVQPDLPPVDSTEERIKQAKLKEIEFRNRQAAEEEAKREGRYVLAWETRKALGQTAVEMLTIFEGSLDDLASAIGARFELPQRDVLHLLRTEFRSVRTKAAEAMRRRADAAPAILADDYEPEGEAA